MKLNIGVLGAGHLGKIHLNCISQLTNHYELAGFYDPNAEVAAKISKELGYVGFPSIAALIDAVDVVDIVTPTLSHYDCAMQALGKTSTSLLKSPSPTQWTKPAELIRPDRRKRDQSAGWPCRAL
jgi:predicted dinucleotide-utilizing enzyme